MSFEGYYQRLCKNGHCMTEDVYMASENDKCRKCGEGVKWSHLVDTTNDCGNPIVLKEDSRRSCEHCESVLEVRYKIPKEKKCAK